jgi:hypothetical protein
LPSHVSALWSLELAKEMLRLPDSRFDDRAQTIAR